MTSGNHVAKDRNGGQISDMPTPEKKSWKRFERIIAAIEYATNHGAKVTWNESIAGRQFDVAIRFTNGPHDYLTLIECKDYKNPVAVEKVDAFATKARDAHANKAVIISSAGFQRGCIEVAQRHSIDLFRLNERIHEPPGVAQLPSQPVLGVYDLAIHFFDIRSSLQIPETNNRLDYLLTKGVVRYSNGSESIQNLLDRFLATIPLPSQFEQPNRMEIPLTGAIIEIPTLLPATRVRSLSFTLIKQLKKVGPHSPMDPHLLLKMNSSLELVDCLRDLPVTSIAALDLPVGFDTVLTPGKFYTSMLDQNYYCEKVENGSVTLVVVEAYMHGNLIQARIGAKVAEVQCYYVEVTDFKEVLRLQTMYQNMSMIRGKT